MNAAREKLLRRAREAIGDAPAPVSVSRSYRRRGEPRGEAVVARLCERVRDYGATVTRVGAADLNERLGRRCAELGVRELALPAAAPWRPAGVALVSDEPALAPADLDRIDVALTGCALAIASTGTLVLDGAGGCGRRALSLVPDLHFCVVGAETVVDTIPDAISRLEELGACHRPLTLVSGPSATSDIELERVEGVHGPRRLELFVVDAI